MLVGLTKQILEAGIDESNKIFKIRLAVYLCGGVASFSRGSLKREKN